MVKEPSQKQIDFATAIAETIGDDLPEEFSSRAYHEFISSNIKEFKKVQGQIRYSYEGCKSGFQLEHSYITDEGFNGDTRLNFNPNTR